MTDLVNCSAALVALPRERASLANPVGGARHHADDVQPRLLSRSSMPTAPAGWRLVAGSTMRGFEVAAQQGTQDGRTGLIAGTYVTATAAAKQHFSIRSGPPTPRQPA